MFHFNETDSQVIADSQFLIFLQGSVQHMRVDMHT